MKKKVYVVGTAVNYADFIKDVELTNTLSEADIVLFTGGEDVNPELYGAKAYCTTFFNAARDTKEMEVFNNISKTQLAVGICRGSQFLCVMNEGKLVQDCSGHVRFGTHAITDGKIQYDITSTHHQMQYPYNLPKEDYDILFKSSERMSPYYCGQGIDPSIVEEEGEPEIVIYHKKGKPKCLAIQGHPEYMRKDAPIIELLNNLIDTTIKSIKK
jgi:gamma-glutamyl-gamma-aminobutyrate hydrolase PuuD